MTDTIRLSPSDDVAIALADLPAGTRIDDAGETREAVKRGHKLALRDIAAGESILRYGQIIGVATTPIAAGGHVHSHNLGMGDHSQDYAHGTEARALPPAEQSRSFMGYHRADGRVGTRNYLGILTSVNCSGSVARFIAEAAERSGLLEAFPNVDGVVPVVHGTGCGMSAENEGYQALFRTLAGYAGHPNFGGILMVGLGCEVMQIPDLIGKARMREDGNFRYMTIQQTGGTRATIEKGLDLLRGLAAKANEARRAEAPASALVLGLQCGGSDGYSGITANPALGAASDLLVSRDVGEKLVARIRWWEDYTARNGGEMDNNPSPGNKRGGLTTILEKSLGAVAKGGRAPLVDVLEFAEPVRTPGFHFMDSPGYDPCSVTGQIASGSTLVAFTTGRGSVSGYKPTPCLKLATNSEMYEHMAEDMDVNCGDIVTSGVSVETKGEAIFEQLLRVASGEETRSEVLGFGGAEFVPWQIGAVM